MEHEEERGPGGEEEAKDECGSDSSTERYGAYCVPRGYGLNLERMKMPDLTELDLPPTMKTHFPDPADLLNFTLTITPDEGMHSVIGVI